MPSLEERVRALESQMRRALATTAALQGQPSDATLSIPHNDSWLFEDNVDGAGGFPGNLRYIISNNVQRVVSARLSIHLAAYRTYNTLTLSATGNASVGHTHNLSSHTHTITYLGNGGAFSTVTFDTSVNPAGIYVAAPATGQAGPTDGPSNNTSGGQSATHNHSVSGSSSLGVTEGAVATAVTIAFDGVDHTTSLGGPFNADVVELDVLRFLPMAHGTFHVIAMQPSGLGRIEAHLRLGVYVAAGSVY